MGAARKPAARAILGAGPRDAKIHCTCSDTERRVSLPASDLHTKILQGADEGPHRTVIRLQGAHLQCCAVGSAAGRGRHPGLTTHWSAKPELV